MAKQSYTARTAEHFRENGYLCERVEQYNAYTRQKHDLYNLFDLLAINSDSTVGIQCTDASHANEHRRKLGETFKNTLAVWLDHGNGAITNNAQIAVDRWFEFRGFLKREFPGCCEEKLEELSLLGMDSIMSLLENGLAVRSIGSTRRCELWIWKKVGRKWQPRIEAPVTGETGEIEWIPAVPEYEEGSK